MTDSSSLQVDIFVTAPIPVNGPTDPAKNKWSPISSTLIQGPTSVVLADLPHTINETNLLADWIEQTAPGKELAYIFTTHAHLDHFGGAPILQKRFPNAKFVASKRVTEEIKSRELSAERFVRWNAMFPEQIEQHRMSPEALPDTNDFYIDGHVLRAYDVAHSDTHATSFLHVPDVKLVVAGDIVYGDYHQHIAEANTVEKRNQWIEALDQIQALEPAIVVPGHKRPTQANGPYLIEATKRYIRVFEEEWSKAKSAGELESLMRKRYPERNNALILELAAKMAFPQ